MDVNMDLTEIIKNAFIFPSKNLETLSIYAILSLLSAAFIVEGIVTCIFGIFDIVNLVIGIICIIIAIIIGLITRRISIQCIKSGIDLFIGFITNIYGNIIGFCQEITTQVPATLIMGGSISVIDAIYSAALPLLISLVITISAAIIIFLIFSFFQAMGEARLANTGSLKSALNIYGAAKDIKRIGVGKVILLSILIFVIVTIIEIVLTIIFDHLLVLSILNIVITPYLALFGQRALGLLYSDIV